MPFWRRPGDCLSGTSEPTFIGTAAKYMYIIHPSTSLALDFISPTFCFNLFTISTLTPERSNATTCAPLFNEGCYSTLHLGDLASCALYSCSSIFALPPPIQRFNSLGLARPSKGGFQFKVDAPCRLELETENATTTDSHSRGDCALLLLHLHRLQPRRTSTTHYHPFHCAAQVTIR